MDFRSFSQGPHLWKTRQYEFWVSCQGHLKKKQKTFWVLTRQIRNTCELLNIFIPLGFFLFFVFFGLSILVVKRNTVFFINDALVFVFVSRHYTQLCTQLFPLAMCRLAVHHVRQWQGEGQIHDVFYIVFTDVPDKSNSQTDDGRQFWGVFCWGGGADGWKNNLFFVQVDFSGSVTGTG